MATETLDLRAKRLDVVMPAGDSLTFNIEVADIGSIPNPVWTGVVKDADGNTESFTCTPTVSGCTAALFPAQTRALFESSSVREAQRVVGYDSIRVWRGRYDIQVAYDGGLSRTFLKGYLSLEEDVTP